MSPSPPSVTAAVRVVVLNWNAAWLTARCVRSLQATDYPAERLEIVVVDNASIDGSLARLRADLPGVTFVANEHNYGFAEGNNRALRDLAGVDYVALINNDAVVSPGWLRPLVAALDAEPDVGAAAPKMLLESEFATVRLRGCGTLTGIEVDGVDVTRRCIYEGVTDRAHDTMPLAIVRTVDRGATVHVPLGPPRRDGGPQISIRWAPIDQLVLAATEATEATAAVVPPLAVDRRDATGVTSADGMITLTVGASRSRRINSLGTALKPWTEGFERWFGALDRPHLATHETWGFSGGGVLLRSAMLADVGIFEPAFFAYYEDTDLAWRCRRRGWGVRCVPDSVVHHLHGGSAGPEAQGFFFLNYRNWLLTVLRNSSPRQAVAAAAVVRRLGWAPFRRNVFGPLRRGRRPDVTISVAWARVFAGFAVLAPSIAFARLRRHRPGQHPTEALGSRLMPATPPRPPRHRSGGPLICYIDVTETLRSGWRAGIQRVVCELVRTLPPANPDLELVLVCWSKVHSQFRRIDSAEYESLLTPTQAQQPASAPPPPGRVRRFLARAMHSSGAAPFVYGARRRRELRAVPQHRRDLLLDRFEPGSVFFDVDASWNPTTVERSVLLPLLRASGVHTAMFLHDLLPQTHRQWFIPQLADVSDAHLRAHLDAGSRFICNSAFTAATLAAYAAASDDTVDSTVVPMGTTGQAGTSVSPAGPPDAPFFLIVGTIEPRKNHDVVLDAFEKVHADHPGARLVVAGRPGWNSAGTIERLRTLGTRGVDWRTDTSDEELAELYRSARVVVVASELEGFGLPVVEALHRGAVVVSSQGGALPEAGGEFVEYFDPSSAAELADLLARHLTDTAHHRSRRARAATFVGTPWSATARAVGADLATLAIRGPADA